MPSSHGFSKILVIIFALGLIWFAAWYYELPGSKITGSPAVTTEPEPTVAAGTDLKTYSNPDLGISFQYPAEWGETKTDEGVISFSQNLDARIVPFAETETCAEPKTIQPYHEPDAEGVGYCRLYENGGQQMIQAIRIGSVSHFGGPHLYQNAFVGKFHFYQFFPEVDATKINTTSYLQSLLDRTANPVILQKIDQFEEVMLSLEIE